VGIVEKWRQFVGRAPHARIRGEEHGQALVEYSLIIAFVVIASVVGLTAIGINVAGLLSQVAAGFP
jgi:Flp pilus assembly pilin Flp